MPKSVCGSGLIVKTKCVFGTNKNSESKRNSKGLTRCFAEK